MEPVVEIWTVPVPAGPEILDALRASLDPTERERALGFRSQRDRERFETCRGALRALLAERLGRPAHDVPILGAADEKPSLPPSLAGTVDFNVAHSGDFAFIALGTDGEVGIDLERWVGTVDEDLIDYCCTSAEHELLRTMAPDQRCRAFFQLWTFKESVLKASGRGLALSPDRVDASAVLAADSGEVTIDDADRWHVTRLDAPRGYVGALATRRAVALRHQSWPRTSEGSMLAR